MFSNSNKQLVCVAAAALSCCTVVEAKTLWSSKPADAGPREGPEYILKSAYPIGNGRLGATPYGAPGSAGLMLNVDSLWSGGPFEFANYTGGNPLEPKFGALPEIRSTIFTNGSGDMSALLGSGMGYGSYRVLGNLTIALDGVGDGVSAYRRELDLNTGVHATSFTLPAVDGVPDSQRNVTERTFCSFPDQVCVYQLSLSSPKSQQQLPAVKIKFENILVDQSLISATCTGNLARLTGLTQAGPPEGMKYDSIAQVAKSSTAGQTTTCDESTGLLTITPAAGQQSVTVVVSAGTNYDATKGNAESNFSFKGVDPGPLVEQQAFTAAGKSFDDLLAAHVADYAHLMGAFELDLPDIDGSSEAIETADLVSAYSVSGPGNPFLEALLFDLSRHLLIASSRPGSLPVNLQGRWAEGIASEWGADYHANINLQMFYWAAEQTGLVETYDALWSYMRDTWVPRGTETAKLLYGAKEGWVVHNEMNIFGHTALKEEAGWANYPAAAAWMMQHVWNAYEYTQDATFLRDTGYPLIKGVAQFWLSQLQADAFTEDGTLVVNPCNSPEHGGTTFGCAHYQQEITHVFAMALSAASILEQEEEEEEEADGEFLAEVKLKLQKLDKGLAYTSWGGLKEWKLPDSYGWEDDGTQHRHLSHLTGWFPGWSIASFQNGYRDPKIQSAVEKTLVERGPGKAEDANAGWAKVWRSACWARLNNTEQAYWELRFAIDENSAQNGLSMYKGQNQPFQIDANFGFAGAVLSMLVVDLPLSDETVAAEEQVRTVVLGPAIPARWGGGSVKGLRIRGGGKVDFGWDENGLVKEAVVVDSKTKVRLVNVEGDVLAEV